MINTLLFLIILIFPIASYSWPCKIDESSLDKSYFVPSLAKTVSIGIVKEENSKLYFISNKPWKYFKIPITTEGCLGIMGLKKNGKYLFISEQTQEILTSHSLDRATGSLNDITLLSTIFIKEISSLNDMPKGFPNTFWRYCVGDRSCQKVAGSCGEIMGVNYKFAEIYKNYSKNNKTKKCDSMKEFTKTITSKCINNFCN